MPKKILIRNNGNEEVDEVFKKFIKFSKAKNLSERTIVYYEYNYNKFKEFLGKLGITEIGQISPEIVEDFTIELSDEVDNPVSVNTVLRAVRVFLNFAMERKYLEKFKVSLIKTVKKVKETYTDEELKLLLKKPDIDTCGFAEYRNWVIINWLLSTGNRSRTVRNIKIKDLDLEGGYVRLSTLKNRYQQVIPVSKVIIDILQEYLTFRDGEDNDYLFCNIYGGKISTDGFVNAISRYNKRRGVSKTSSHLFRHTFAKLWIKNGGDIFRLQKILGHKSLEMVKEYVNLFSDDLKDNFEEFNPINQFSISKNYIHLKD
ncbi:MAG: tyrosine-type recombinase/integrase [Candidatus Woesearchaeota archaeon]